MIYKNEPIILQEAYYGKNPELVKCEGYIDEIREEIVTNGNPNNSPAVKKLCDTLAKLFNFETMRFYVIQSESFFNAYTVVMDTETNKSIKNGFFDLVKSKDGIRYKSAAGKHGYIVTYNYAIRNYSSDVVMACILHEVGHNFFLTKETSHYVKSKVAADLNLIVLEWLKKNAFNPDCMRYAAIFLAEYSRIIKKGFQNYNYDQIKKALSDGYTKYAKQDNLINNNIIVKAMAFLSKFVFDVLFLPFNIIYLLIFPLVFHAQLNKNKKSLAGNSKRDQGYANEKFADSFAISYG